MDFIFLIDIIFMFCSTFTNKQGKEVWNNKEIAYHYVFSLRFYLDTGSLLGSDLIQIIDSNMGLFGFLKITRVFRLGSIIARANIDANYKAVLNFLKLTFYLGLFLHCLACFWFKITLFNAFKIDQNGKLLQWYAPTDWIFPSDAILFKEDTSILY